MVGWGHSRKYQSSQQVSGRHGGGGEDGELDVGNREGRVAHPPEEPSKEVEQAKESAHSSSL